MPVNIVSPKEKEVLNLRNDIFLTFYTLNNNERK